MVIIAKGVVVTIVSSFSDNECKACTGKSLPCLPLKGDIKPADINFGAVGVVTFDNRLALVARPFRQWCQGLHAKASKEKLIP